jgi:hypothetical protein
MNYLNPKINRINNLKLLAALLFIASVGIFYMDYTKEKFLDKNDLFFFNGSFKCYEFTNSGKTHSFTFYLENYNDIYKINTDYLQVLNFTKFKEIPFGDKITIGIHPSDKSYLNSEHYPIFVYSIEGNKQSYLSIADSVKIYNSIRWKAFSFSLFVCSLICVFYYYQLNKFYK